VELPDASRAFTLDGGMGVDSDRDSPVREGDIIAGRYRVERVLATGGMGVVVAARHLQLNQRVAVKVLTHNVGSAQATARFLTEAKASALLRSDHVVHVSDVGTVDSGHPFMVMELLEGLDLAQVLEQEGKLPIDVAVDYLLQACEGLAEAHAARIVHRDLKPGNLFRARRPDGSEMIKVLDFGVSKALSTDVRAEGTVTTTDAVFGSPLYMSPEQMQSASKADERSDIWSLGVVLYELVTRKMPFDAESMAGLAVRIATDPPTRLAIALPGAPPELEAVIFKCLEKHQDKRYPNIAELAADLEPFAPESRPHVERIQRLVFGTTIPPRAVPSVPSLRRLVAHGAETLGPLDSGESSAAILIVPEKKRRAWPVAAAVVLAAGIAVTTAMLVHKNNVTTAAAIPPPPTATTTAAPVLLTPPPVETLSPITTIVHAETVASASVPKPHVHRDSAPAMTTVSSALAAPSATVLTGISRDRK
jgi:serine/threonine protein kinase